MERPLYGQPTSRNFQISAGIYFHSHKQARLLMSILQRAMQESAGKPEEALLAKWHNDVVAIQRRATDQNWTGWDG